MDFVFAFLGRSYCPSDVVLFGVRLTQYPQELSVSPSCVLVTMYGLGYGYLQQKQSYGTNFKGESLFLEQLCLVHKNLEYPKCRFKKLRKQPENLTQRRWDALFTP